jgi:hypothetical protein
MQQHIIYRTQRPDIREIMRTVQDAVQALGLTATTLSVAHYLSATEEVNGETKVLPSVLLALDLLELQKIGAVTKEVLQRLLKGLSITALQQLARTLRKDHQARQLELLEIKKEQQFL